MLWKKTEMVPLSIFPSKTDEFPHQRHVAANFFLKLF
jgi:hypothetical protein